MTNNQKDYFIYHVTGPIASIFTPFLESGEIDYRGLHSFINFSIDAGARTVLLTPGNSLYNILTDDEIADITKFTAETINKRAMFIAATNHWWTGKAIDYVSFAHDAGANAVLVSPPDRGMTVTNLIEYYKNVSAEHPVFILSGRLSSVGLKGAIQVIEELLSSAPNVVGIKEDYMPQFAHQACLLAREKWAIFAGGAKETHMDMFPYGCNGYMSVFIHHKPEIAYKYWKAIEKKDITSASKIIQNFDMPLFRFISTEFSEGGDAAIHGMMELSGICGRWRRKPLPSLSQNNMEKLKDFLISKGML